MEEHMIEAGGALISLLLLVVGVLIARSIKQIDTSMQSLSSDHKQLSTDLQEVKGDLQTGNQLREFQDRRISELEKEKRGLYNAFNEMDRLIYRKWGESVRVKEE